MATFNTLTDAVLQIIDEYTNDVKLALEKTLDETAIKIIDYIRQNAPRSGNSKALADSFITEETGSGVNKTITIYSKSKGRIIHLIEFGFKHTSGKFVMGRPFMRPSFDLLTPKMLDEIRSIIQKGGK